MGQPYEIVWVRRANPPPGGEGSIWHRYVIAFDGNYTIHGCRQGGLKAVTRVVEEIIAKLNERHRVPKYTVRGRGRVNLVPKKKPTCDDRSPF